MDLVKKLQLEIRRLKHKLHVAEIDLKDSQDRVARRDDDLHAYAHVIADMRDEYKLNPNVGLTLDELEKRAEELDTKIQELKVLFERKSVGAADWEHALGDLLVFSENFRAMHVASNGAKVMSLLTATGVAFEEAIKRAMEKMNEGSRQSREGSTSPKTG